MPGIVKSGLNRKQKDDVFPPTPVPPPAWLGLNGSSPLASSLPKQMAAPKQAVYADVDVPAAPAWLGLNASSPLSTPVPADMLPGASFVTKQREDKLREALGLPVERTNIPGTTAPMSVAPTWLGLNGSGALAPLSTPVPADMLPENNIWLSGGGVGGGTTPANVPGVGGKRPPLTPEQMDEISNQPVIPPAVSNWWLDLLAAMNFNTPPGVGGKRPPLTPEQIARIRGDLQAAKPSSYIEAMRSRGYIDPSRRRYGPTDIIAGGYHGRGSPENNPYYYAIPPYYGVAPAPAVTSGGSLGTTYGGNWGGGGGGDYGGYADAPQWLKDMYDNLYSWNYRG